MFWTYFIWQVIADSKIQKTVEVRLWQRDPYGSPSRLYTKTSTSNLLGNAEINAAFVIYYVHLHHLAHVTHFEQLGKMILQ